MQIKLCTLNVQCLRNKVAEVELLCCTNDVDILCVCEHWLSGNEISHYKNLTSLNLVNYYCRASPWGGGGVAIFVKENFAYSVQSIDLKCFCEDMHAEFAGCLIPELSMIVVAMYRAPSGNIIRFFHLLELCLDFLMSYGTTIVIGTDHNINLLDDSSDKSSFLNLLRSFNLFCSVTVPTRGSSSLDNFITNLDTWNYEISVSQDQIADHKHLFLRVVRPTTISTVLCEPKLKVVVFRNFNDDAVSRFVRSIEASVVSWSEDVSFLSAGDAFLLFFNKFRDLFDHHFPEIKKTVPVGHGKSNVNDRSCRGSRPSPKLWFSPELAGLRGRVLLVNDLVKTRPNLLPLFRRLRRDYRCKLKEAKAQATVDSFQRAKNPCKAAWNFINGSASCGSLGTFSSDFATADGFNAYFVNSVNDILNDIPGPSNHATIGPSLLHNVPCVNDPLKWEHVNGVDIVKIVNSFKPSDSRDVYGMSPSLIKRVIYVIAPLLANLLNSCLDSGVFPEVLKISKTVPVYKKGSHYELSSFRPISIIPVFGKIYETVLFQQLYSYFEVRSLLVPGQYGFRRQRSTVSAVASLLEVVLGAFEDKKSTSLLLCDLSRAFDTVQHDILLKKLGLYLGEGALGVLVSYLANRQQVVSWNGAVSTPLTLSHGVPQGSVLGPLLFIVDINDLYFEMSGKVCMFADDSTLFTCGADPLSAQKDVKHLLTIASHWFEINKFALNESKTQEITFSLGNNAPGFNPVKLLGFVLDSKLTWEAHVDALCIRLSRVLYLLRRLADGLTSRYLRQAYYAFFHSLLSYGILLWGHSASVNKILVLQKRALRIVSGAGWLDHCKPLFVQNRVFTVISLYIYHCICRIKNSEGVLTKINHVHEYYTRGNNKIFLPRSRLQKSISCFPVTGIRFYNMLPLCIRSLPNPKFQRVAKNWLVSNPMYSVKEYFELDHARLIEYL